jgi:hypothetical protein
MIKPVCLETGIVERVLANLLTLGEENIGQLFDGK